MQINVWTISFSRIPYNTRTKKLSSFAWLRCRFLNQGIRWVLYKVFKFFWRQFYKYEKWQTRYGIITPSDSRSWRRRSRWRTGSAFSCGPSSQTSVSCPASGRPGNKDMLNYVSCKMVIYQSFAEANLVESIIATADATITLHQPNKLGILVRILRSWQSWMDWIFMILICYLSQI